MEENKRYSKEQDEVEMEIDLALLLKNFWKSFRSLWWAVVLLALVGAGSCLGYSYLTYEPMYKCSATFTVATGNEDSGSYNFYYSKSTADQLSKTFPYVLDSSFFQSALLEKMGKNTLNGTITSETISNSNLVTMKVQSSNPQDAKEILDTALEIYPQTARFVLGSIQFNLLDEPQLPQEPCNGDGMKRAILLGGGGGVLLGCFLLGLTALFRKTAANPEEMKKITSLRCLAAIPLVHFKARKKKQKQTLSILDKRLSYGYRESIQALQTRIENNFNKQGKKVLLVASTASGEGKTTLAINLAEMFARRGKKVLLIDGDLRKQDIAPALGLKDGAGIKEAAEGKRSPMELVRKTKKSGIWFLGGKKRESHPAPILSSEGFMLFMDYMRKEMDIIILDSPPCEMFQDAGILADYADSILYVVKYDSVSLSRIWEGISFLREKNAQFMGYVFNSYPESAGEYGYGRYGYGKYGYGKYGYGRYGYGKYGYGKSSEKTYGEKEEYGSNESGQEQDQEMQETAKTS